MTALGSDNILGLLAEGSVNKIRRSVCDFVLAAHSGKGFLILNLIRDRLRFSKSTVDMLNWLICGWILNSILIFKLYWA